MAIDPKSPDGFPIDQINDWVFDLDNTIYPAKSNLVRACRGANHRLCRTAFQGARG
jgi:hypothetical protein